MRSRGLCGSEGTKISKRNRTRLILGPRWAMGRGGGEFSKERGQVRPRGRRDNVYCGWGSSFTFKSTDRSYWKGSSKPGLKGHECPLGEFSVCIRENGKFSAGKELPSLTKCVFSKE